MKTIDTYCHTYSIIFRHPTAKFLINRPCQEWPSPNQVLDANGQWCTHVVEGAALVVLGAAFSSVLNTGASLHAHVVIPITLRWSSPPTR